MSASGRHGGDAGSPARARPETRRLRRLLAGSIIAASLLVFPAGASAADFTVDSNGDAGTGTLREAIDLADANTEVDTITITATGTIQLAGELQIDDDLTITGPGADALVVGGGIGFRVFNITGGTSTISNLTVANGHLRASGASDVSAAGGGIANAAALTLDRVVVRDNTAEAKASGAGNSATARGGAVSNSGVLIAASSNFRGNRVIATADGAGGAAVGRGGAIVNEGINEVLLIDASTFSGNSVRSESLIDSLGIADGGAIYNADEATILRSTIVGNEVEVFPTRQSATVAGGGISGFQSPTFVVGVTIARNRAVWGSNVYGTGIFANTIVADPAGPGDNCFLPPHVSNGYNIDDDNTCGFDQPTDQLGTDPLLAANLSENGGPTPTLALLPGSPAIDQGTAAVLPTDQRGLPRPSDFATIANAAGGDGSDIGAFEVQVPEPEPPATPAALRIGGPDCRGLEATIVGTDAGEEVTGTDEIDVIVAGAGDDRIRGLGGNDVLCGGEGRDRISGDAGFDKLEGQAGNDSLNGGTGRDKLFGQAGADRLKGGGGRDTCRGGGSHDVAIACEVERGGGSA